MNQTKYGLESGNRAYSDIKSSSYWWLPKSKKCEKWQQSHNFTSNTKLQSKFPWIYLFIKFLFFLVVMVDTYNTQLTTVKVWGLLKLSVQGAAMEKI